MLSLYIHIPFCLQKCRYCDFVSLADGAVPDSYVNALCAELQNYSWQYRNSIISTIYIGGGTPSLLSLKQLTRIVQTVRSGFTLRKNLEFTLEVNPETYNETKFRGFQALGVNRVSLGIQSFNSGYLMYLGRIHSTEKAQAALRGLQGIFANVSLDLINNIPGQTLAENRQDLLAAVSFAPQHISCYELTLARGTPLAGENPPHNELDVDMYRQTKEILEQHGYKQYEISSYAWAGFESRHNLAYWSDEPYLGAGLAAHSYDKDRQVRWANTSDLAEYTGQENRRVIEPENSFNKIMMGLRKNSGIPAAYLSEKQKIKAGELSQKGLLILEDGRCRTTAAGQLVLNKILLELM